MHQATDEPAASSWLGGLSDRGDVIWLHVPQGIDAGAVRGRESRSKPLGTRARLRRSPISLQNEPRVSLQWHCWWGAEAEAELTDVRAPSVWDFDIQIPGLVRRSDDRLRPSPARVPELAPNALTESRWRGDKPVLEGEAIPSQISEDSAATQREELATELADLKNQISGLRRERDELLAIARPLSAAVAELESKHEVVISLRTEIQALRRRKSSLERSLAALRRPTEVGRRGSRSGKQEFHDS